MEEEQLRKLLADNNFEFMKKSCESEFGHIYQVKKDGTTQKVRIIQRKEGNDADITKYSFRKKIGNDIVYGFIMEKMEGILFDILNENKFDMIKKLGEGGFGLAYQVTKQNKYYAAKLIELNKKDIDNEADIIKEFRGQNIVKVSYVIKKPIGNNVYGVIIMEEAPFKSLSSLITDLKNNNLFDLIYNSPFEIIGDNLLKFFISQLIQGLEILKRNNFCHFDIKPANILIFNKFYVKWADFGLLRDIDNIECDKNMIQIPGGTRGYFPPEYYQESGKIKKEYAFKCDYFALGAVIYFIKYGKNMLNYFESYDNFMTSNTILEQIEKKNR